MSCFVFFCAKVFSTSLSRWPSRETEALLLQRRRVSKRESDCYSPNIFAVLRVTILLGLSLIKKNICGDRIFRLKFIFFKLYMNPRSFIYAEHFSVGTLTQMVNSQARCWCRCRQSCCFANKLDHGGIFNCVKCTQGTTDHWVRLGTRSWWIPQRAIMCVPIDGYVYL